MKKIKILLLLIIMLVFVGCTTTTNQVITYEIKYQTEETLENAVYEYNKNSGMINLPILEIDGYYFLGWSLEGEDEIYLTFNGSDFSKELIFYPVLEEIIIDYTISYRTEETLENAVYKYNKNSGIIILPILERELYEFIGWSLDGESVTYLELDCSNFSQNLVLYPVFEKSEKLLFIEQLDADIESASSFEEILSIENRYATLTKEETLYIDNYRLLKDKIADEKQKYKEELLTKEKAIYEYMGNAWVSDEETYFSKLTLKEVTDKLNDVNILIDELANDIIDQINDLAANPTFIEAKRVNDLYLSSITYVKDKITNYNILEEILEKFDETYFRELAEPVIEQINLISKYVDLDDKLMVEETLVLYNSLPSESKLYVDNLYLLEDASQVISDILDNKQEISYVLGKDVYESKEALYNSFYTDLYYFMLNNGGTANLINNNINDLEAFLRLGVDPNGGGTTNMRGIGNIAGWYFLQKDYNGLLKDQPTSKFFGFMYQNGKYNEFLEFLVRFFAYWRIDERYATETNRGADIFAESWAPMVDTSKFFYYTVDTSYVQTERMRDCFNYIPGVLNVNLPTTLEVGTILPTNITRRGYIFDGWYTNSEYTGNKVTTITSELINNYENQKVILYAKWIQDEVSKAKDDAATVDVIINNLMPNLTEEDLAIVQKARYMYENLSELAKTYVTLYDKLINREIMVEGNISKDIMVNYELNGGLFAGFASFEDMYNEFLSDFNLVTGSNINNPIDFINSKYTLMKSLLSFYQNTEMYDKWVFLAKYFKNTSTSNGLIIQSDRIIGKGTGDLEYFSKAIGTLLLKQNGLSDNELLFDASNENIFEDVIRFLEVESSILYTQNSMLKTPEKEGFKFGGWYIDAEFTTRVYSVKQLEQYGINKVYAKWEK